MARKIEQEYTIKDKGSKTIKSATGKINKDLNTVSKTSKSLTTSFTKMGAALTAAFAGLAAIKGITGFIQQTVDLVDNMAKVSK